MSGELWPGHTEAEYSRCVCGHGPKRHWFPGDANPSALLTAGLSAGTCTVKSCDCDGYDHITGKPDHPLAASSKEVGG